MTILTIEHGKLVARRDDYTTVISDYAILERVLAVGDIEGLSCSSSLDFPEEYTTDPLVLCMCNDIRG